MTVRLATAADEDGIFEMCCMIHQEIGHSPMSPERVRMHIQSALRQEGGILCVIGEPGDLKACLYLTMMPIWFSDDWQLVELFNFVHPDHRKSTYARDLIEYAKRCADQLGVILMIGVTTNVRMEAKVRLYQRLLPKAGEYFVYRPGSDQHVR